MPSVKLFRLTEPSDDETTLDAIEMSLTVQTKQENAIITLFMEPSAAGIGNNQGAEQQLGDQQALGEVEDIIKIKFFVSKRNGDNDDGLNSYLVLFEEWKNDDKINDNWDLGRFGIVDNNDHTHDLIPINTGSSRFALLWEKSERETDFKGNREWITIWFRVNRGDGT